MVKGRRGLYTVNSDSRVILFFSSGACCIPMSGGGKGMTWQEVATQGSNTEGDQVLFQAQVETVRSYFVPCGDWKFP